MPAIRERPAGVDANMGSCLAQPPLPTPRHSPTSRARQEPETKTFGRPPSSVQCTQRRAGVDTEEAEQDADVHATAGSRATVFSSWCTYSRSYLVSGTQWQSAMPRRVAPVRLPWESAEPSLFRPCIGR